MYFYVYLAVLMFYACVFKNVCYESVINMFFYVFYLQINVFNIYEQVVFIE